MKNYHEISDLLLCETPLTWLKVASQNLELLLIDHAHCEKKAAATALRFMHGYPDKPKLLQQLSRLAREELRHFEQVLVLIQQRGWVFRQLSPARYGKMLHQQLRTHEPARLTDSLIIGAFIEARSCERFEKIIPYLDEELGNFYRSLLKSEARHFRGYLELASLYANEPLEPRIAFFAEIEKELIESPDSELRFHSGAF